MKDPNGRRGRPWFWSGVVLLSISAFFWLILMLGVAVTPEIDLIGVIAGGLLFTFILTGLGIYCVKRGSRPVSVAVPEEIPSVAKEEMTKLAEIKKPIGVTVQESNASWWDIHVRGNPQERETAIEGLCRHLTRMGLDATVELKEDNLRVSLLKLNLGLETRERVIGLVRVANRNIDLVELEWCIAEMGGDYGSFENEYRCNYIVLAEVEGSGDKLKAKLKPITKGFLSREVVDFKWEGKELAQMLSSDANLKDMLYRMKGILTYLEIIPYRELQCVKIRQWPDRKVSAVSPTIEAFEVFDRIAQHIRSIANVRPDPSHHPEYLL